MRAFRGYHPVVNLIYFVSVISYAMLLMHPICLAIALICALACYIQYNRKKAIRFALMVLLPVCIFTALVNPAFNHQGITVLCYLPSGNPLTLEAVAYGVAAGVMLTTVICWFGSFHLVMTSDKLVYLFGKLAPALSLLFSMTLRLVPRFRMQLGRISQAQKGIGMDGAGKVSVVSRAKAGLKNISAMITQALEQSVETADSMRSRGYGLPNRTAYALISFDKRDLLVLGVMVICAGYVLLGCILGDMRFSYYPAMNEIHISLWSISFYMVYALLCLMPVLIQLQEEHKWKAINARD